MLKLLVRFVRDPVKSRRQVAKRLLILFVIFVAAPPLWDWIARPRDGFMFDFWESGVLIVFSSALLALYWVPTLAIYSRTRRQRERYLTRTLSPGEVVQSVYLTPNLLRFIESEAKARLNPYTESVSLVSTSSTIEFWTGGATPTRSATIDFSVIETVRFVEDDEHFQRPEITTAVQTIPLYAVVGLFRISRRSSRNLYDRILAAFDGATNSSAPAN